MGIMVAPVQPVANQKASPEKGRRGKGQGSGGFAQLLSGMAVQRRASEERRDGFGGRQPHHRDTREEVADVLRRIEQVNSEIRIRML